MEKPSKNEIAHENPTTLMVCQNKTNKKDDDDETARNEGRLPLIILFFQHLTNFII
jgi:hypothetical protein